MKMDALSLDLRLLAPDETVQWGIERERGQGLWKRCTKREAKTGPSARAWPLERLTIEMLVDNWGVGTYRLMWFASLKGKRRATSRAFDLPQQLEANPDAQQELPDVPAPAAVPAPAPAPLPPAPVAAPPVPVYRRPPPTVAPAPAPAPAPEPPMNAAQAILLAADKLNPEQLAAFIQGRPADDSDLGRALGQVERLSELVSGIERNKYREVNAETELRVTRAKDDADLRLREMDARHSHERETQRDFFQQIVDVNKLRHDQQTETVAQARDGEVAALQGQLDDLQQTMLNANEQALELIEEAQEGNETSTAAAIAKAVGPDVMRGLKSLLLKLSGTAAGQPAGAVAESVKPAASSPAPAPAEKVASVQDLLDQVVKLVPQGQAN